MADACPSRLRCARRLRMTFFLHHAILRRRGAPSRRTRPTGEWVPAFHRTNACLDSHDPALPVVEVDLLVDAVGAVGLVLEEGVERGAALEFVDHRAAQPGLAAGI